MPAKKNRLTAEEQRKRFEEEVRKRKEAGDFDQDAAEAALDKIVRLSSNRSREKARD